ncbi:MAG: hypothetical protein IKS46_01515 [Clostridia bacterium]|nr:hypothetical protein [Clostridia bacterium]
MIHKEGACWLTFIENRAINPSPDSVKEAWIVKVPIQKKYMLTVTEASEYFGVGEKRIRRLAVEVPELSILNGNRWMIIREKAEEYFRTVPVNEKGIRKLP